MLAVTLRQPRVRYGALIGLAVLNAIVPGVAAPQNVLTTLSPHLGWWVAIHLLQVPFIALVALTLWPLLAEASGRWALIGRIGLACFALGTSAAVAAQALGLGALIAYANTQPAQSGTVLAAAVDAMWVSRPLALVAALGALGWLVALLALVGVRARSALPESLVPVLLVLALALGFSGLVEGEGNVPYRVGALAVAVLLAATAQPRLPIALVALGAVVGIVGPVPGLGAIAVLLLAAGLALQEPRVIAMLPGTLRRLVTVDTTSQATAPQARAAGAAASRAARGAGVVRTGKAKPRS